MTLFSWLRNRSATSARQQRVTAARFRPQLEALEDRWLPSTLTVISAADSGPGSLRADIAAAHSGDTIVFAPSLNGKTITLTSGQLDINKGLTIQGPGAGQLTISGGNTSRVFEVFGPSTNVTLSGLTITQGSSWNSSGYLRDGGGIVNANGSTLTIENCIVSNNHAAYEGGGIANLFHATLKIIDSTLLGNSVSDGMGDGMGGGLYSVGGCTVTMQNCTVSDNSGAYEGGGLWLGGTTTTMTGCTVSGNSAGTRGCGIYSATPDTLTVTDSVFSDNTIGNLPYPPIYGPWVNGGGNTGV